MRQLTGHLPPARASVRGVVPLPRSLSSVGGLSPRLQPRIGSASANRSSSPGSNAKSRPGGTPLQAFHLVGLLINRPPPGGGCRSLVFRLAPPTSESTPFSPERKGYVDTLSLPCCLRLSRIQRLS